MTRLSCSRLVSLVLTACLSAVAATQTVPAAIVYDLKTDWSDLANPTGPWSYQHGSDALPHAADWQGLSGDFIAVQPAWARAETGNTNLPSWMKIISPAGIANDWQLGDIVTHSTDGFNGVGSGPSNVIWTSPLNGRIDISGGVWMGRDIGRGNHWDISLNGTSLTGGDIFSGDSFNRTTPFAFAAGSGGSAVLSQVPVVVGDVVRLQITKTSVPGDYAGVNLTIIAVLSGDYNFDNIVDAADYVIWRKSDGTQTGYDTWRTHFGETLGSGAASASSSISTVPEPASSCTLLVVILVVSLGRRAARLLRHHRASR